MLAKPAEADDVAISVYSRSTETEIATLRSQ